MDWDELNGAQRQVVREALMAGFDRDGLTVLMAEKLNKDIENYLRGGGFVKQVFDLVGASQKEGWTGDLVAAAQKASNNRKVKALSSLQQLEIDGDQRLAGQSLESIVQQRTSFEDLALWTDKLTQIRHQVCRIEDSVFPGKALGTGFLVAADLVMTNYHVVKQHLTGVCAPANLGCRFDYAIEAGGQSDGTLTALAADWMVANAPFSPADLKANGALPQPGEMDFALLRLAAPVGDTPAPGGTAARGWIKVSTRPARPEKGDILFIAQHPQGRPIKLAVGSVLSRNANETRVRYDANTEPGSSGSPCFNVSLDIVALHHAGDPNYLELAKYNEGVPIESLLAYVGQLPAVPRFW